MRLSSKVLLLTLGTTLGLSGIVLWVVTSRVTAHEQSRARESIRQAIAAYHERLESQRAFIDGYVRQVMGEPVNRSLLDPLESAEKEESRLFAYTQLREEIFEKTV